MDPLARHTAVSDYITGHTTYAGAAQKVLEHVFGSDPALVISLTSATAPGVVETYTNFKDIADAVVDARVWAASTGERRAFEAGLSASQSASMPCVIFSGRKTEILRARSLRAWTNAEQRY